MNTNTQEMSDQEILDFLRALFKDGRVFISSGFVVDPDTDMVTHEILNMTCGELTTSSDPILLPIRLKLLGMPAKETAH